MKCLRSDAWKSRFLRHSMAGFALLSVLGIDSSLADAPFAGVTQALHWRSIGPHRGGRTRAVTGIPGQPHTFLVGAVNGGVWRTDDDGRTWSPLFDAQPTQSIGAIAVAPSDPKIIYVGSGEGLQRPDLSVGNGIYRSDDGGRNWTHTALDDAQQIPEIAVDPRDSAKVYAAVLGHPYGPNTQRGIFKSIDAGRTFRRVLYRDENTGGSSIAIDAGDSATLYAGLWNVRSGPWEDKNVFSGTAGGLYKSTDSGEHWRRLTVGLPDNLAQIQIAVAPSRPGRLYATVATNASGEYASAAGLGVYRSDDSGETWAKATLDPRPALRIGGGDLPVIKVDPQNADVLYSASIVTMKSTDGGEHWWSLKGSPGGDDYQNLWISPHEPGTIALVGDQGAIVTVNGGVTWSSWYNQPTAQLYHIGITPTYPYRLCSGQQESGSVCVSSRGNDGEITFRDWHPVGVIEYGYVVPDPLDTDIIYGAGRNVVTKTHLTTGQVQNISPIPVKPADVRTDRTEPILFSPQDPHHLYYAASRLYATDDAGISWTAISPDLSREEPGVPPSVGDLHVESAAKQRGAIYAVSASPLTRGLLWAGTDDGLIWMTDDDGKQWRDVTPPGLSAWSKVTQIEASHFDRRVAYASVSRFRVDDLRPYLYRTRDAGRTWQSISTGLPDDAPANAVREDPTRRGLLFAATEKAVWVSVDDGDHWQTLQLNLPHTSMRDLAIHDRDLIVATHGRAFWILDDISPLRQMPAAGSDDGAKLLQPAQVIRVRRDTNTDTSLPPDEPAGRNPPEGAVVDYYLKARVKEPVLLEIRDAAGMLVQSASSGDSDLLDPTELQRELIPAYWIRHRQPLSAAAGMHRWIWDLHYPPPRSVRHGFPISAVPGDTPLEPAGPLAIPGNYRVRLSIGKQHWDQPLIIAADPRVNADQASFATQLSLQRSLAQALDGSTLALLAAQSLQAQLDTGQAARPAPGQDLTDAIELLKRELAALQNDDAGADPPAKSLGLATVNGDIGALYEQVSSADASPTAAQIAAAQALLADWSVLQRQWQTLQTQGFNAVNLLLRKAHRQALSLALAPPRDAAQADSE